MLVVPVCELATVDESGTVETEQVPATERCLLSTGPAIVVRCVAAVAAHRACLQMNQ